jgi:hypothetical protein
LSARSAAGAAQRLNGGNIAGCRNAHNPKLASRLCAERYPNPDRRHFAPAADSDAYYGYVVVARGCRRVRALCENVILAATR